MAIKLEIAVRQVFPTLAAAVDTPVLPWVARAAVVTMTKRGFGQLGAPLQVSRTTRL